jgi:signal peptidase I
MEKPRFVSVAIILSLIMPGLGHLYCGNLVFAIVYWILAFCPWLSFIIGFGANLASYETSITIMLAGGLLVWIAAAIHAGIGASKSGSKYKLRSYNLWYFYILVWILGFSTPNWLFINYSRNNLIKTYPYGSDFMRPNLLAGDLVMVDRRDVARQNLARGSVVAITDPNRPEIVRILRLIGVSNDSIELTKNGLVINQTKIPLTKSDQQLTEKMSILGGKEYSILVDPDSGKRKTGKWQLSSNQIFLLGDNRMQAIDSTSFGPISKENILGKAIYIRGSLDPKTKSWRKTRKRLKIE